MVRDLDLEVLVREHLEEESGLTEKSMFGGRCWLLEGNLLCGASDRGLLIRLGDGNEKWTQGKADITPMIMQGRPMKGWVWAGPEAIANLKLRRRLLDGALAFVRALPPK